MKRRPYAFNPLRRLILELRYAAAGIRDPFVRRVVARNADQIPETLVEKHRSHKGEIAKLGRRTLRALATMTADEDLIEARKTLKGCADALDGTFPVTSEEWLGRRKRRNEHAAA